MSARERAIASDRAPQKQAKSLFLRINPAQTNKPKGGRRLASEEPPMWGRRRSTEPIGDRPKENRFSFEIVYSRGLELSVFQVSFLGIMDKIW